jgi:flagellar biosynthesis protein FliQ
MDITEAVYLGQQGMLTIGYICGPILITALVVGITVSLFQAVTQIQEMTLVFVPKIFSVFIMLAFMGPWMLGQLLSYGLFCFESATVIEK